MKSESPAAQTKGQKAPHYHSCERPFCNGYEPYECDGKWCHERHECRTHSEGR
jgi:hypothetical protein